MKAVRVKEEDAENVRQKLLSDGILDRTRKLVKRNGFIDIPVTRGGIGLVEQEKPEFYIPKKTLESILDIPLHEKELLPSGWQLLGDIIIITLREELETRKNDIAKALLSMYPGCRTVLLDRGISGQMRQPEREIIAGKRTETIHRENGCLFKLDAMRIMYSQGNLAERKRMSRLGKGEVVVDMFAGIGYFSIPMAVHSKPLKIISIEINPVSFGYMRKNIRLNLVEKIIEPVEGDCALVTPQGIADRVIMGYFDAYPYLEKGISALVHGGILHYHEAVPEAVEDRPVNRIVETAGKLGRKVEIIEALKVKKYSPGVWHVVVDAKIF
ncbi:MAG: class I SAM-dependent methyltransferase family protein [Candidatus Methanoperedens sp.]|nr:MAG: class I SAM-dependent methyltransferase family protein [Candidatus Methanoperedens sp.]